MRTKNAKRLWPVPATLTVVALAALLAFGLLVTNDAQPAAAQDDLDCTVAIGTDNSPQPVADGDDLDCSVHVSPAVIGVPGDGRETIGTGNTAQDADVTAWVYAQDGTIEGGMALTDVWDHDAMPGNVDAFEADRQGTPRVPTPKATKFSAIKLEIDPASEGLGGGGIKRSIENITVTPAGGKSKVTLYIYYSNDPVIIPAASFNHDGDSDTDMVKQITEPVPQASDASGTMVITFLSTPSLTRADAEDCDHDEDDATALDCSDPESDSNGDSFTDLDDKADPASDLYVANVTETPSGDVTTLTETVPTDLNQDFAFGSKGPYDINEGALSSQLFVVAQIRDGNGEVLSDTDDSKAKSRVTFTIDYASGSDLETNPITPVVDPVDMDGKAMTLVNHWNDGDKAVRVTVSAMYSGPTGDLDLGSVVLFRDGPATTADFGTYSCDENKDVTKAAMGCEAGYEAVADMRFARDESVIINGKFADALGSTVLNIDGKPIKPTTKISDDDKDTLTSVTEIDDAEGEEDMFTTDAMLLEIGSDAEYRDYTITLTNGESGDDEVTQELTFAVTGPPASYEFVEPMMYIPTALGSSQRFTVKSTDENGNVPDFTGAKDVEVVVLGVEGSYVTGREGNNAVFDPETGEASFTIFTPVGATSGQTVLIQIRVNDEVVATHTVMFGGEGAVPQPPDPMETDEFTADYTVDATSPAAGSGMVDVSWTRSEELSLSLVSLIQGDEVVDFTITLETSTQFSEVDPGEYDVSVFSFRITTDGEKDGEIAFGTVTVE